MSTGTFSQGYQGVTTPSEESSDKQDYETRKELFQLLTESLGFESKLTNDPSIAEVVRGEQALFYCNPDTVDQVAELAKPMSTTPIIFADFTDKPLLATDINHLPKNGQCYILSEPKSELVLPENVHLVNSNQNFVEIVLAELMPSNIHKEI